ncbi:MAG: ABC transporter permease [Bacteroidia bacterium]|nr:ABC transporter permease [Bacteroidia bacterium]
MLLKIAWRNIWRSKTRSIIVILSIAFGIWSVAFLLSFSNGMVNSYIERSINNELAHIQIHHPKFMDEPELGYHLGDVQDLMDQISKDSTIKSYARRTLVYGMISTAKGAQGIKISGISPEMESQVTSINNAMATGEYLSESGKNPVIIGQKLAKKLGAKERSKVVLTFQDIDGNITAGAFRVKGIFETYNALFDEGNVFVRRKDLNALLNDPVISHEIALKIHDLHQLDHVKSAMKNAAPNLSVQKYSEISPEVELYESQISIASIIIIGIVMLALIFGIINTMLMAVLERYKELGILMAIGMNKVKVFFMIVIETILLALIGAPIGIFIGWLSVRGFSETGINLSSFSEGLRAYGISELIYPELSTMLVGYLAIGIGITAILASVYPAMKAIRLDPVSAIRKL